MAQSVNMDDNEIFAMWLILHEQRVRELREQFEKDTGEDALFKEFGLWLYMEAQDILDMNLN